MCKVKKNKESRMMKGNRVFKKGKGQRRMWKQHNCALTPSPLVSCIL